MQNIPTELIQEAFDFFAVMNMQGDLLFLSKKSNELIGVDLASNHNQNLQSMLLDDNPSESFKALIKKCLEQKVLKTKIILKHHSNNELIPIDLTVIKVSEGESLFIYLMGNGNTESKAEDQLVQKLQEMANIGGWELDVKTGKTIWTEQTYRIHGIDKMNSTNLENGVNFYASEDRPKIKKLIENCIQFGVSFKQDLRIINTQGKIIWVRVFGYPIFDQKRNIIKVQGTFQNVNSEIKDKESHKLLEKQYARKSEILKQMKFGVFNWDILHNKLVWDEGNFHVFGVNPESFIGAYEAWEMRLHSEYKQKAIEDLNLALEGEKDFNTTFVIMLDNGEIRYIGGRGVVERDDQGRPIYMYGVNWDRTDEVLLENELDHQRKISMHNAKLASIGQLAAGVGHEINNPLSILKGHLYFIQKEIDKDVMNKDAIDKRIQKSAKSIERIKNIIKGLRIFSRADFEQSNTFDLFLCIQESVELISEIFESDGIKIKLTCKDRNKSYVVRGFPGRIQQVIINLLNNAKDAMINLRHKKIDIHMEIINQVVQVKIKDYGMGIDPSIADKLFDPFFTTKPPGEGTGIGLAIVENIIKEHRGEITFKSTLNKGTTFIFSIPLTE